MKDVETIYNEIRTSFYGLTKINVQYGSVLDCILLAASIAVEGAYKEVEDNKDPHIYTNLTGDKIDSEGILTGIARMPNEKDDTYLLRMINWNKSNVAANTTAVEMALLNTQYSSHIDYIPKMFGAGTAALYIIPKSYDDDMIQNATAEAKDRIKGVVSPTTVLQYIIPTKKDVKLVIAIEIDSLDINTVHDDLKKQIADYINAIPNGEKLSLGKINKIGVDYKDMQYFNVLGLIIDNEVVNDIEVMQTIDSKFIFDNESNDSVTWITKQ